MTKKIEKTMSKFTLAIERVKRAKVKATDSAIRGWVRSVGPDAILKATLREIREVADAF